MSDLLVVEIEGTTLEVGIVIPPEPVDVPVDSVNGEIGAVVLDAADVGADATGTAASAVSAHEAAGDPHPQYLQSAPVTSVNAETGAVVLDAADVGADAAGTAASAVSAHEASGDPHPQYVQTTGTPAVGQVVYFNADGTISGDADLKFDTATDRLLTKALGNATREVITIDPTTGNMGIRQTSPVTMLHIGDGAANVFIRIEGGGNNNRRWNIIAESGGNIFSILMCS